MSYVFNMVGGSSGGGGPTASDAILTVTVPTGSTVTMTKGGVTLTPTMWVQAADPTLDCALFVIQPSLFDSVNAWTVTVTLSGDTRSDTVIIDNNEQYDLNLGDSIDRLKSDIAGTGWAVLSDNIGDVFRMGQRYGTRTTSEPVIFVNAVSIGDSYWGYGVISLYSTISCTYSEYGELSNGVAETSPDNVSYY